MYGLHPLAQLGLRRDEVLIGFQSSAGPIRHRVVSVHRELEHLQVITFHIRRRRASVHEGK